MKKLLLLALCLAAASQLHAEGGTAVTVKKPQDKITLAMPFTVEMEASCPDGFTLTPDSTTLSNDDFETVTIKASKPASAAGQTKQTFKFTVMPFAIGTATFPAVSWLLTGPSASSSTVQSPELPLNINPSPDGGKNQDIADIRPPWSPFNYWLLLIALVLLAGGYALYRYLNREKFYAQALAARQDNRPPEVIAFEALDKLLSSQLWEDGKAKSFYNSLSDILRDYLTRRTKVLAHNYNTTELCRSLDRKGENRLMVASVRKFLQQCDLVKFAKYLPTGEEKNDCVELLRMIIRQSTPAPAPENTAPTISSTQSTDTPAAPAAPEIKP